METILLTLYVLACPAVVLVIFGVLLKGYLDDWKEARREGRPMI